jgi:hypothetical protein
MEQGGICKLFGKIDGKASVDIMGDDGGDAGGLTSASWVLVWIKLTRQHAV